MSEAQAAAAAAVPPPPPPPAAPAAVVAAPPPPAVVAPAAVPAAEPAKPVVAAPAPEVQKPVPEVKPAAPAVVAAPVEIEFKLPEGAKYEPKAIDEMKAIAKEHGITAKAAEAIFALDQKYAKANAEAAQKEFLAKVEQQAKSDVEALKADKEFGGALYDKTVEAARSAEQQFFGEDFAKLMKASGLQNHPAVVKGLARIRKAIAEDNTATRAPGSQPPPVTDQKPMSRTDRWKQQYLPKKK